MAANHTQTDGSSSGSNLKRRLEVITALIMALATVFTAWCSFESAAWTRKSGRLMTEVNSLERQAGLLKIQALQALTIHTAMFMELLAAQHDGNEKLVQFYADRFPPDVRKAYDAWLAQKPFENPKADAHPFVPQLYEMRGEKEADEVTKKAADQMQDARRAGSFSGQYLANTVLFATVLFFVNAAGKFEQRRVRLPSFIFAIAIFLFAVIRTAILPR